MFRSIKLILIIGWIASTTLSACNPVAKAASNLPNDAQPPVVVLDTPTPQFTPTPQPFAETTSYGPNQEDFPAGINPLTGLEVPNPSLLDLPALLISITHFPPMARPQAGLSFAPWVFEYLISTGSTRFLGVFYGQYPTRESPITGDCDVRTEPFEQSEILLGNRVWLDLNANGIQNAGEPGIGGVCVNLFDAANGKLLAETTTDTNGYYGFNVSSGRTYFLEFKPGGLAFSPQNVGNENQDSDVDQASGRSDAIPVTSDDTLRDAGLLPQDKTASVESSQVPTGEVGPVRSGRLVYIHIQKSFQDSCLIYAGATNEIRDLIPGCAQVFKEGDGGIGVMLDVSRLVKIAEENAAIHGSNFNYSNNLFEERVPDGGQPVKRMDVFVSELNQSAWVYDPSVEGWMRYVDDADENHPGVLHPDTDRLTGRQIYFDNIIILFAEHEVLAPAIIDMYLQQGESEDAILFRDGQMFQIKWSTRAGEYEQRTGLRRPIAFQDKNGNPFPLHPGRTWIFIATPYSRITELSPGKLKLRVIAPPGAGNY